jgi:hypothetical protein
MSIGLAIICVGTSRPNLVHTPLTARQRPNWTLVSEVIR